MRFLAGLALVLLLSASVAQAPDRNSVVRFEPITLDRDQPNRKMFGAFRLLGAWRLSSSNPTFGGISSMRVSDGRVTALSDAAFVLQFRFDGKREQSRLKSRPLPGIYTSREPDRDSESMTRDPRTGEVWVGFEASNTVRRFSRNLNAKRAWAAPPAMARWPENQGPEGLVRLSDGRFLIFSEASPGPELSTEVLLFPGDPILYSRSPLRFFYKPPSGFSPTDAAELPDGRVLVLNRHFSIFDGVSAMVTVIDPRQIAADRIIPSKLIVQLKPPLNIDNMEALSIERIAGRIIVWIGSDDNFNPMQQTLLFKFELDPAESP